MRQILLSEVGELYYPKNYLLRMRKETYFWALPRSIQPNLQVGLVFFKIRPETCVRWVETNKPATSPHAALAVVIRNWIVCSDTRVKEAVGRGGKFWGARVRQVQYLMIAT